MADHKKRKRSAARSAVAGLPPWAPYALFALLTLALFREFIVSGGMLFGSDVMALGYFARKFYVDAVRDFGFPFWNPHILSGLPFVDAMHGDIFYPTTILKFFMPVHRGMGWKLVIHIFLAGVVTYAWLRHLKLSRVVAMWGGATYMLAPVLVTLIYPGHDGKLFVTALTPLALWVTDLAMTRGELWRFGVLSLTVALLIFTAHMQLAYFTTWAIGALAIFRLVQGRRRSEDQNRLSRRAVAGRLAALVAAGMIGGLAIGAVQLWTPLRYLTKYSQRVQKTTEVEETRGYAYSASWSLHPEEAVSLVVPEFIGANLSTDGRRINTYWGRNPFKLNHEYGGLIPLLLIPIAFLGRRRRGQVWFFTGLGAAALIYALGATTPLFHLYYWLVPGVKLFRAPSSIMFIFAIAAVTAGAFGLEATRDDGPGEGRQEFTRKVGLYLWGAAGLFLVMALLGSAELVTRIWTSVIYADIPAAKLAALEENLPNIKRGLWISATFIVAIAGAWQLRARGSIKEGAWLALVVVISIVDVWRVNVPFVQVVNPDDLFPRDDTIDFLVRQNSTQAPFRVFAYNAPYQQDHFALFGIDQVLGHHGNEIGRYRDLTDDRRFTQLFGLLNVRYIVSGSPLESAGLREVFRGRRSIVYELPGALPRAFLVSSFVTAPDSTALDVLLGPGFNPADAVLLESAPEGEIAPEAQGRVEWVQRDPNASELRVSSTAPALLLVSENYYPSWHATIDGEETPILRADYTLRAVRVPAGEHTVRFVYRSPLFRASLFTSLVSGLAVSILILGTLFARRRRAAAEAGA